MPTKAERDAYFASEEWADRRELVRERANGICERCGRLKIYATHHKTYERFGYELPEDLWGLCDPCHAVLSAKPSIDPLYDFYYVRDALLCMALAPASKALIESLSSRHPFEHKIASVISLLRLKFTDLRPLNTLVYALPIKPVQTGDGYFSWGSAEIVPCRLVHEPGVPWPCAAIIVLNHKAEFEPFFDTISAVER